MKNLMAMIVLVIGLYSSLFAYTATEDALMTKGSYTVAGTFGMHDFSDAESAFDWAFTTKDGASYQLQGELPTEGDVFGWKSVDINTPSPDWYMISLGSDVDGDGSTKFDWVLFSTDMNNTAVYKLMGVADNGTFLYSDKLDIKYNITTDGEENVVIMIGEPTLEPFDIEDMRDVAPYKQKPSDTSFVMSQTALVSVEKNNPSYYGATIIVNGTDMKVSEMVVQKGDVVKISAYSGMSYNYYQSWEITVTLGAQVVTDSYSMQTGQPPAPSGPVCQNPVTMPDGTIACAD